MKLPPFDKYYYYSQSVQSPADDMEFLERVYKEARGKRLTPKVMREDFCAAFLNSCAWVKRGRDRIAHGVDLDPEPLQYGKDHYFPLMPKESLKRLHLHQKDVLGKGLPKADIICALNFSYFIFKERETLKAYFKNCLKTLNDKGVFVLDCFGGAHCWEPNEEETEYKDHDPPYSYYWDQDAIDPLTHHARFYIHFKRKGEAKRTKVFAYEWRMWTVAELKDLLLEAGFSKVNLYWEGTTKSGEGDGHFKISEKGDECEAWVCYIAGIK